MTKLEKFLATPISDHKAFANALNIAVKEIRAEELNIDLFDFLSEGDSKSIEEIHKKSIYHTNASLNVSYLESIPEHLNNVNNLWENTATVYRGTRLPDNSGSFDFDGIHTTPQLNIAKGYANGSANSSTGIGRLLKHIDAGFITEYEVPLSTPTYQNFEFEDLKKSGVEKELSTLHDLKNSLVKLSNKDKSEFHLDMNDAASPALKDYYALVSNSSHYESILPINVSIHATYYTNNKDIIKINPNNQKWDQLLARVQEASLRDFYEIVPLEKLLQNMNYIQENLENKNLLEKAKQLIQKTKEDFTHAPWECFSMKDVHLNNSQYLQKRPYITNSRCVGSAMDTQNIERPEIIQNLEKLFESLQTNDIVLSNSLLNKIENKHEVTIAMDKEQSINAMLTLRNIYANNNQVNSCEIKMK